MTGGKSGRYSGCGFCSPTFSRRSPTGIVPTTTQCRQTRAATTTSRKPSRTAFRLATPASSGGAAGLFGEAGKFGLGGVASARQAFWSGGGGMAIFCSLARGDTKAAVGTAKIGGSLPTFFGTYVRAVTCFSYFGCFFGPFC